ncbi:MAG: hypothetical protein NVS4B11_15550 [Ktedonobacteraceae bacterium]
METKRCAQCHKLLRAETQICSRCGYTFAEKKRKTPTRDLTRPSLPPASPHRAGHYSGLHPEDQPYQSSMIAVQRPPVRELAEVSLLPEPFYEELGPGALPTLGDEAPTEMSVRYEKPRTEVGILNVQRVQPSLTPRIQHEKPLVDTDGVLPAIYQPLQQRKPLVSKRTISVLLILSCIFFLLASGILVYALTPDKSVPLPSLSANPTVVRTGDTFMLSGKGFAPSTQVKFTHDSRIPINDSMKHQLEAMTDRQGVFSVDVIVPEDWSVGAHTLHATDEVQQTSTSTPVTVEPQSEAPPQLQLLTTSIDLGTDRAGTTSSKRITLKNAGGGQLTWQQKSDAAAWLTASPISNSYTFAGSSPITITANRSNLVPQAYIGHITFIQKDSSNAVKLTVTMKVDSAPAALNVSTSLLTFSATPIQSVPTQSVTLQNSGGKQLNWQASATTNNGTNWLYLVGSSSGQIDPEQSQQLVVGIQAQQLAVGSYQGAIALAGGASATINVSLTVIAPGNILITPNTLSFAALTGQSITGKTLTVQNTGGQSQGWSVSVAVDQGNWLSITQQSGTVDAGGLMTATVNINSAVLKAGAYQGIFTFTVGSQLTYVPITVTITTPPSAAILVQNTSLIFQTAQKTDPVGQWLTITNTGNAILNWMATESGNGAIFAPLSVYSGSISAKTSAIVEINPSVSTYPAETLTTTITIADKDVGTTVVSQKIPVTVTIQSQAAITASPTNSNLTVSGTTPSTQTVTITNSGTAPLNWVAAVRTDPSGAGGWLSIDTPSGTLAPGASKTIVMSCDGTNLQKGASFSGSVQISDSDTGTTVTSQTIYVTFVT